MREWQAIVAAHAREAIGQDCVLVASPVALRLVYLYSDLPLDVDNILKPIHDGLIGVILRDDSIVTDVEIRRRRLGLGVSLREVSPVLGAGLDLGIEFVYISLRDAPQQDVLP